MVNETKAPVWPPGWAPSCHTSAPLTPPPSKRAGRADASKFSLFEDACGSAQGAFPLRLKGLSGPSGPWVWEAGEVIGKGGW